MGAAIVVALSRIAAANTTTDYLGGRVTSYEPGAAVGVLGTMMIVGVALGSLLSSYAQRGPVAVGTHPPTTTRQGEHGEAPGK